MMRIAKNLGIGLLAAFAMAAAGGWSPALADAGPDATTHVHMENTAFAPGTVNILRGEAVAWDNHDVFFHTVSADDGSFGSGSLGNGGTFQHTFTTVGTFPYRCAIHAAMTGTVVVLDPDALPDLAVTAVAATETLPGLEQRIDVTVANLGAGEAPAGSVAARYAHQGQLHDIGTAALPTLAPGASATVGVTWSTAGKVGDFVIEAEADPEGALPEAGEANNTAVAVASVLVGGIGGIDLLDPV